MKVKTLTKKSKALLCSSDSSCGTGAIKQEKDTKVKVLTKKSKSLLCSSDSSCGTGLIK